MSAYITMILSGKEIEKQVKIGNIVIDPFDTRNVNPNSYNYRLGDKYTTIPDNYVRANCFDDNLYDIPTGGLLLVPGKVYLAHTYEIIGSNKFVALLIGRSSLGRMGLFLEIAADLGNLGPAHKWTLELTCVQPIVIYPHMKIGQVSFWIPEGEITEYTGLYTNYDIPMRSLFNLLIDTLPQNKILP